MNVERLQRVADILLTVPAKNFDLGTWKCNSTACAVGQAASDPQLQEEGLELVDTGKRFDNDKPALEPQYIDEYGNRWEDWEAVSVLFDISLDDAEWLFTSNDYSDEDENNPLKVRNRILEFIKEGSPFDECDE